MKYFIDTNCIYKHKTYNIYIYKIGYLLQMNQRVNNHDNNVLWNKNKETKQEQWNNTKKKRGEKV